MMIVIIVNAGRMKYMSKQNTVSKELARDFMKAAVESKKKSGAKLISVKRVKG